MMEKKLKRVHAPDVAVQINNNGGSNQMENLSLDQLKELLSGTSARENDD